MVMQSKQSVNTGKGYRLLQPCCFLQAWDGPETRSLLSSCRALCYKWVPSPCLLWARFLSICCHYFPTLHSSVVLHVVILQWVIMASGCPPCGCPVSVHQAAAACTPCPLHQLRKSNPVKPGCRNHHSIAWGLAEFQSLVTGVLVHCLLFP